MKILLRWISMILMFCLAVPQSLAAFRDVSPLDTDIAAYNFVQSQGIMTGSEDGNFHPTLGLTRCELLKVALVASHTPLSTEANSAFPDIAPNDWCKAYANTAKAQTIISGYPNGTFQPNKKVTQIEALKILINSGRNGIMLEPVTQQKYSDAQIYDWWSPYIQFAQDTLYSTNQRYQRKSASYGIQAEMSRAETAYLVWQLFKSQTPTTTPTISMGLGMNGNYSLVNLSTGAKTSFLPAGYTLLDQNYYQDFPSFLILQKDQNVFAYQVSNKALTKITSIAIDASEKVDVRASISEKDMFLINVELFDPNQEGDMGVKVPLKVTSYLYDATHNITKTVSMPEAIRNLCRNFDSLNNQFYAWTCEEGIGNVGPLSLVNMQGEVTRTLVPRIGTNGDFNPVRYSNGRFFSLEMQNPDTASIRVITTGSTSPTQQVYPIKNSNADLKQTIIDAVDHPYGITIDEQTSTIIVGNANKIILLPYNDLKEIIGYQVINDPQIYPNFIFAHQGKLYYFSSDVIRVVDLKTFQTEKSLPGLKNGEITLFN